MPTPTPAPTQTPLPQPTTGANTIQPEIFYAAAIIGVAIIAAITIVALKRQKK